MKIIAGLGNPGTKYELTRHNAGFIAVDFIADRMGERWRDDKKRFASIVETDMFGERIILLKPLAYMNESGKSVSALMSFFKLLPKSLGVFFKKNCDLTDVLTLIHDDIDLPLGSYKISLDSRSAGHRGVGSVMNRLKTQKIRRIRIGIRPEPETAAHIKTRDYVLGKLSSSELEKIYKLLPDIYQKIFLF
jgi:peptidyl-tRNA hydrolase, PTH1 family